MKKRAKNIAKRPRWHFVVTADGVTAGFVSVHTTSWTLALQQGLRALGITPHQCQRIEELHITKVSKASRVLRSL